MKIIKNRFIMDSSISSMDLKDVLLVGSPMIKALVDTFVTPKLVSFRDRFEVKAETFFPTEENFKEYYFRTFKKLIVVNTLVFRNTQTLLSDIYLPLTISSINDNKVKAKIDGFPSVLSDKYGNILITDIAGMGKSTMMKKMFIDIIEKGDWIPLFIELRRLNSKKKLIDEIQEQLNSINRSFNSELLSELLAEGGFMIFLDGYDEISLSDREVVTKDIQEFISKASNNRFILTSRPENTLTSFGNFQEFKIEPLTKIEAFNLLRIYDKQGIVSKLLIKKLQEKAMSNIEEFLTNPLLVSLLFTAFEHKQTIPFKKYLFYRQVYDASFDMHDLTKGDSFTHDKKTNLEIDDFHRVMRYIGFICFKMQKIEFVKDEILALISKSKLFCTGLDFTESDLLEDLLVAVPLFIKDGNYYRWAHKSLQEYFAAQFIYLDLEEKKNSFLKLLYFHDYLDKFSNVLDLYYDMDYKSFRNIILYEFLKEFNSNYITNKELLINEMSEDDIIERSELSFKMILFLKKDYEMATADYKPLISGPYRAVMHMITGSVNVIVYVERKYFITSLLANRKHQIIRNAKEYKRTVPEVRIDLKVINELMGNDNYIEVHSNKRNRILDKGLYDIELNLWRHDWKRSFIVDYKKAINLLGEIEQDLRNENDKDELSIF